MILEQRIYDIAPVRRIEDFLEPYERLGLPIQRKILGGLVGYFVSEIGPQNQLNHFWAYTDLNDRTARREQLAAHRGWQECVDIIRPMIVRWRNVILKPTNFSPMRSLPITIHEPDTAFDFTPQHPGTQDTAHHFHTLNS